MNLIRAGRRWLDLDKLVMAEEAAAGEVEILLATGRDILLTGRDAADFRAVLEQICPRQPADPDADDEGSWRDRPPLL